MCAVQCSSHSLISLDCVFSFILRPPRMIGTFKPTFGFMCAPSTSSRCCPFTKSLSCSYPGYTAPVVLKSNRAEKSRWVSDHTSGTEPRSSHEGTFSCEFWPADIGPCSCPLVHQTDSAFSQQTTLRLGEMNRTGLAGTRRIRLFSFAASAVPPIRPSLFFWITYQRRSIKF